MAYLRFAHFAKCFAGRFSFRNISVNMYRLLNLLAVLPVEAEAEDVSEEAAPLDN